jgi:serine protease Do
MQDRRVSPSQKFLSHRRWVLLASAGSLGIALLIGGPGAGQTPLPSLATAAHAEAAAQPAGFADIVAKVKPAVFSVRVKMQNAAMEDGNSAQDNSLNRFFRQFGMPNQSERHVTQAEGSGFFISADGYAVTNNHVVDHATSVRVTTDDGQSYNAKVIGTDPKTDLAVIKVEGNKEFPYVKFASHPPRVGDWVLPVGNPFGLGGTVTAGIVSASARDIGAGPYDDFIQIDAPINRGNSGGPAFDVNGNVVGVTTAIYSPSGGSIGIGFAIPSDTVQQVVSQLKDKGTVTRGWLGVEVQAVTPEIADGLGMKQARGALVAQAQPNTPAAKAGIKAGDVITAINDTPVKDSRDLAKKTATLQPGASVKLSMLREGKEQSIDVTLGKMPDQKQARASNETSGEQTPRLGLTLAPANEVTGAGDRGVAVVAVDPDSVAADHGLKAGDVITDVGGKAVTAPADVGQAVREARTSGKHTLMMRVKSEQGTRFVALPLTSSKG